MNSAQDVNADEVIAELADLLERYEEALISNDVQALQDFFWPSPHAIRFGATEQLYGAEEINTFRQNRVINFSERKTLRRDLVCFGRDLGIATLEFSALVAGAPRHGRQSQVWVRFHDLGWRIVSAHVSHRIEATTGSSDTQAARYLAAASSLLGLEVDAALRSEVEQNLEVMASVVAPLMALELQDTTEPAFEYRPV